MNEPQLPAEIEKRFNEEFAHLSVLIDQALSYTYVDSKKMGEQKIKEIKHFLATALEEQKKAINNEWMYQKANDHDARIRADERKKVIEEVEGWIENNEYSRPDHIEGFAGIVDTDDLQDKLNQLKDSTQH